MVLVDGKANPQAAIEFTAEITPLEEVGKKIILWENYEPVIISRTTNQVCTLVLDDEKSVEELNASEFADLRSAKKYFDANKADEEHKKDDYLLGSIPLKKGKSRSQDDKIVKKFTPIAEDLPSAKIKEPKKKNSMVDEVAKPISKVNLPQHTENSEGGAKTKVTFEEKVKDLKKNAFKGLEDLFFKKKKSLRHLKIESSKSRVLRLRFKYHPEYITPGQKIFVNDSTMKAIGVIKEIFYEKKV